MGCCVVRCVRSHEVLDAAAAAVCFGCAQLEGALALNLWMEGVSNQLRRRPVVLYVYCGSRYL